MHSAQHLLMFFKYPNRNVAWFYSSNTSFQHGCCELKTSYLNTNFKIVKIHNKKNTRRCSSNNKKHYDEILMMQRILVNEDKHRESWVHSSFISLLKQPLLPLTILTRNIRNGQCLTRLASYQQCSGLLGYSGCRAPKKRDQH